MEFDVRDKNDEEFLPPVALDRNDNDEQYLYQNTVLRDVTLQDAVVNDIRYEDYPLQNDFLDETVLQQDLFDQTVLQQDTVQDFPIPDSVLEADATVEVPVDPSALKYPSFDPFGAFNDINGEYSRY